jgi:signal transduction histidine kinase
MSLSLPISRITQRAPPKTSHKDDEQKRNRLSQRYAAALRKHLMRTSHTAATFEPALRLGREAVALGLATLELARIHERALVTLKLSGDKKGLIRRAEEFFSEAVIPILETHRAARQSRTQLNGLKQTLSRHPKEPVASDRPLQRDVIRRKLPEDAAVKSEKRRKKCLEKSLWLEQRFRKLTHRVLAAQEEERSKISHELQDEIAQTLLGINVRLLNLKMAASGKVDLTKEVASTQRLVVQSIRTINRFADVISKRKLPVAHSSFGRLAIG